MTLMRADLDRDRDGVSEMLERARKRLEAWPPRRSGAG
jgi:hypothetical protein